MAENLNTTSQQKEKFSPERKFRAMIEQIWLKAVRFYTYNSPIDRGKYRLFQLALRLCRYLPTEIKTQTRDGRKLSANLTTGMNTTVFFLGEYEKSPTKIVASLLKSGDVCLDAGANFGWYTTLFYKHCGAAGAVHAFEPVPMSFEELRRNYKLMGAPKNVFINNLALGERCGEITINLFPNQPTGHASVSRHGKDDFVSFQCKMITLDSYLEKNNLEQVDFVKLDIEGAEMMFFKGAEKLFKQTMPPIWLIEMALEQTRNFGYLPNDLINFMRERAAYDFYKVNEIKATLKKIENFSSEDIGANVVCIPRELNRNLAGLLFE